MLTVVNHVHTNMMAAVSMNAEDIREIALKKLSDKGKALTNACKIDSPGTVEYLIKNGDLTNCYGSALCVASENGNDKIVKLLLNAGAYVHYNNDEPIRLASECGWPKVVNMLLDAGAGMSANDHEAMALAEMRGHTEVVTLLKEHAGN